MFVNYYNFYFYRFEKWISHLFRDDGDKVLGFLGMKCLYEMQDIDVIKSACTKLSSKESNIVEIRNVSFTPLDSFNLCKFISKCGHIKKIVFTLCKFDKQSCFELEKQLSKETRDNCKSLISLQFVSCILNHDYELKCRL